MSQTVEIVSEDSPTKSLGESSDTGDPRSLLSELSAYLPFIIQDDAPLVGIPFSDGNREVTRYFVGDAEADAAMTSQTIQEVLKLAGSWSNLDWDEMQQGLDRIRHESL